MIKDVLYVPKMAANLFSVRAALQEGYEITFSDDQVIVKHGDDIIPAYSDGCLFAIELKILKHDQSTRSAYAAYSLESWHKRFGHCGVNLIKKMLATRMVDGLDIGNPPYQCEDCMLGKSCRKPHPSRTHIRASKELAILHFDTVDTLSLIHI